MTNDLILVNVTVSKASYVLSQEMEFTEVTQ
jgi:hypothetical protein